MRKYRNRKSRKFRKSHKNRTRRNYKKMIGGETPSPISPNAKIPCCVCEEEFSRKTMLVPAACLKKHKERAHRICEHCWWNPDTGFAREDAEHGCPGCKKGLPLNPPLKPRKPSSDEIIEITDD